MKILILTPIQIEHEAVVKHLAEPTEEIVEGARYVKGKFEGRHATFEIITLRAGKGNDTIAVATERAVKRFQPLAVILAGVSGGVKDVDIGDIVVGTKFYDYEYTKESAEGTKARPQSGLYNKHLRALAESVANGKDWEKRLPSEQIPNVVFGPIASGHKVINGTDTKLFRFLKDSYNDTIAVEMEAAGFGGIIVDYPFKPAINIRGVSDLIDGKSQADAAGSQPLAAAHAAAFVFELIHQIDPFQISPVEVEIKNRIDDFMSLIQPPPAIAQAEKKGEGYALPPNRAPRELERLQPLTPSDRQYIFEQLEEHGEKAKNEKIKVKLKSLYDFQQLGLEALRRPAIERYETLEKARVNKVQVVLQNYRSNSSVRDRRVEPVKIDANLNTLQAFDVEAKANRHYLLSRIERVLPTEHPWQHEASHVRKETDDFRIADNHTALVEIELDVLARNLLTEYYPRAKRCLSKGSAPNTWYYGAEVNHKFLGLINFIMGNANHVEIIGPESLKERMREEAEKILDKLK